MKNNALDDIYPFWGKAQFEGSNYHLLVYHSLDVAIVFNEWISQHPVWLNTFAKEINLSSNTLKQWLFFVVSLHDVGKCFDVFQSKREDVCTQIDLKTKHGLYVSNNLRHDVLGFKALIDSDLLFNELESLFDIPFNRKIKKTVKLFGFITFGHHGKCVEEKESGLLDDNLDVLSSFIHQFFEISLDSNSKKELANWFSQISNEQIARLNLRSWSLAGMISLSDWLASAYLCDFSQTKEDLNNYINRQKPIAKQTLTKAGLQAIPIKEDLSFKDLFPAYANSPTPTQAFCDTISVNAESNHLFILEDVTGSGKTEAALTLAAKCLKNEQTEGIYVALPTQATSNAMYDRMAKAYHAFFEDNQNPSLILAHGNKHLSQNFQASIVDDLQDQTPSTKNEIYDGLSSCTRWLASSTKMALMANVGVGTIDQILIAALRVKYQSMRFAGLFNKVIIIDECHAYDPYMLKLLEVVLRWAKNEGISVILLSATLPNKTKNQLLNAYADADNTIEFKEEYPLLTHYEVANSNLNQYPLEKKEALSKKFEVDFIHKTSDVFTKIEQSLSEGKCVCWIRNTVADAIEAYQTIHKKYPQFVEKTSCFHARFTLADRLDIEEKVLHYFGKKSTAKERKGRLLIATQVAEQSLDFDVDVMISDIAPIDLLIQRAGRQHRHKRDIEGNPLATDQQDQRPTAIFYINCPSLEPKKDWLKSYLPKASFVYSNDAIVWKTAKTLSDKHTIQLPEDARFLVEQVYSEDLDTLIPDVLIDSYYEAEGKGLADENMAANNHIILKNGYTSKGLSSNTFDIGDDDVLMGTRLAEESLKLFICTFDGEKLIPYHHTKKLNAWEYSCIHIRKASFNEPTYLKQEVNNSIQKLKQKHPFKYDASFLVVNELTDKKQLRYVDDIGLYKS